RGSHPAGQGAGAAISREVLAGPSLRKATFTYPRRYELGPRSARPYTRRMKITPLDIRQKRFETALRGFSRREVEAFLDLVAAEFEELVKENISLKEELKRTSARLEQHLERERTLQETMVTAQRISEDLKAMAKKD